jgi:pyruvate dehydrogenase E2 component (dihydrolipoamide acetyltransferase)
MPKLGLTMASGTIARWIKRPGDAVREGEPLVEVSTDKISYEVESPATGTVASAIGAEGDEFDCGAAIGTIALAGETDAPQTAPPPVSIAPDVAAGMATGAANRVVEAPRISAAGTGIAPTSSSSVAPAAGGARIVASPAARRLARERGVTLHGVRGSGPRGRITMADVPTVRHAQHHTAPVADDGPAGVTLSSSKGERPSRLPAARRAIFDKMTAVGVLPIPQVEHVVRVDALHALIERRGDFGWTAFAVFATARLLRDHPDIRTDATTGAPFERIDVGFAADTAHGLIVPVVRGADALTLADVQHEIVRLSGLAREGALTAAEVGGACFSISNVGPQGVERVAPLPDPPQTAILGIGAATLRPAVVDGAVRPARMLTCVLSFDHRFVDGAPAARFLAALVQALEHPGVFL